MAQTIREPAATQAIIIIIVIIIIIIIIIINLAVSLSRGAGLVDASFRLCVLLRCTGRSKKPEIY